ncbi:MAG: hypothetical protein AB8C95_13045 [Phycisphaeraceae bacterium]
MYHLTCPSCQDVTESPFVRSGAVVRCTACENKYRIKSAYVLREVHSGPRTLDESDSILRSDSVDIDPDELPPVSIDDDGNVVGLSGLSELMRFSDNQAANEATDVSSAVQGKASRDAAALPSGKTASSKSSKKSQPALSSARARAQALKRKKRNQMYIAMGGSAFALIAIVVIILQVVGSDPPDVAVEDDNVKPPSTITTPNIDPNDQTPPDETEDPTDPNEVEPFNDPNQPERNPDIKFVAPWLATNQADPPADIATVLTPASPLTHEGWYVMNPPRGSADAAGVSNVELDQIVAAPLPDGSTLLSSTLSNNGEQTVMRGELHLMLLDSTGNVFAETYAPLVMVGPRSKQPYALTIPTRYWKRSRGVRAAVTVQEWADKPNTLKDVRLHPANLGPSSALRISVKHTGDKTLRSVTILIHATDDDGNALASFLLKEENLYIREDHWLDLLIATPLPPGKTSANWSAIVVPG